MSNKNVLAFDFGASSGRAMLASFDGEKIALTEVHRFSNDPVEICGTLYWDVLRLFHEIKQGIMKAAEKADFDSIAIDTWGVDFGLLDKNGKLLANPVHYRDSRTAGMVEKSFEKIDREKFYSITGNQFMELNTAFQLFSLVQNEPELLERAEKLLFMPDLFAYFLTGEMKTEYSIASTSQLLDAASRQWSYEVIDALGIPRKLFAEIVPTGSVCGMLKESICEEFGITHPVKVICTAGHDTQCAMAAVPTSEEDFIFVSCGTWSLFGTELSAPLINETSYRLNLTNEGGAGGKISFLKNIIGLWMIQETRRQYIREGDELSFAEMETLARQAKSLGSLIDPDDPAFTPPGNIPRRVREYCKKSGQAVPETKGEVLRCIYESLAEKYRCALGELEECTGKKYSAIHMVGGGIKDRLLCEMTAERCGIEVKAGPVEATALGNAAIQLMTLGEIATVAQAREIIARSEKISVYSPH